MTINTDAITGGIAGALAATLAVAFVDELLGVEQTVRRWAAELRSWLVRRGVLVA